MAGINEINDDQSSKVIDFKTYEEANRSILNLLDDSHVNAVPRDLSIPKEIISQFEKIAEINSLIAKEIADPESSSLERIEILNGQVHKNLRIPELMMRQMQTLEEMNKSLTSDFQIPKETLDTIKDVHKRNIISIRKANSTIEQIKRIDPHYFSSLDPILFLAFRWNGIMDSLAKSLEFDSKAGPQMYESLPELRELYNLWKQGDTSGIDAFFDTWFSDENRMRNLIFCLNENDLFRPRMHIIEKALVAHLAGDYELSIPILLSQLDGIFLDKYKNKSHCMDCAVGAVTFIGSENKRVPDIEKNYFCFDSNNISRRLLRNDNDYLCIFLDHILKTFETMRHDILHGIKTDYHEKEFSTKLILAMINLRYAK